MELPRKNAAARNKYRLERALAVSPARDQESYDAPAKGRFVF